MDDRLPLLSQTPRTWDTGDGYELRPDDLHMEPDARAAWVEFYNMVETAQAPDGELADARPFASKAAEQAARIAGVVAVVEGSTRITFTHMQGAIEVVGFYLNEHLRLTGAGRTDQRHAQLRSLHAWMDETGPLVLLADVLQKCPRPIRKLKAAGIRSLLSELSERGYIREAGPSMWEVRHVQA